MQNVQRLFFGRPSWSTQPVSQSPALSQRQTPAPTQRQSQISPSPAKNARHPSTFTPVNSSQRSGIGGVGLSFGGKHKKGVGLGIVGAKRHRKIAKGTIRGITNGDIRRLARRGGVKRIQGPIYEDMRKALKDRLTTIVKDCVIFCEHRGAKTVTVSDVIFALQRLGRPIYGFGERINRL